eukprot:COSAG01_NODE_58029_length_307_cov_1.478469_1_plen_58_part_01
MWSTLQSDVLGDLALHCPARRAAAHLQRSYLFSFETTPCVLRAPPPLRPPPQHHTCLV